MILGLAATLVLAATASDVEADAAHRIALEFERVGRQTPVLDPALSEAARRLAKEALVAGASDVADPLEIAEAVSDSGATDPAPRALVMRGYAPEEALKALSARTDLSDEPATQAGVGAALDGDRSALVALLSDRKARLSRFPRTFPRAGATQTLCGELEAPLARAELYVTQPAGSVSKLPLTEDAGPSFCGALVFPANGRYTVEVIGRGPRGPEVASVFFVDVGGAATRGARVRAPEPATLAEARPALFERINQLRKAQGLDPVALDDALSRVAQAYSDQMAAQNFFSHVAPDGADLRARLHAAGYLYQAAGENLGLAQGPLAAHFGIEHSPGHRKNLLDPTFTRVGIGVTFQKIGERPQAIVTEILAHPAQASADPLGDAYRAINEKRGELGLRPLKRNPTLERLASEHVVHALALDLPKARLPNEELHQRVFEAMDDVKSASIDFFVLDDPHLVTDSRALQDPDNDRIGVGVTRGSSPTYGNDKYWVVVVYASSR